MVFDWNTNNITNNICNIISDSFEDNLEQEIILGRIKFIKTVEGCCGQMRNDSIFPLETSNFEDFKKEAVEIIEKFQVERDIYSIEYFYGYPSQNFREDGESIFRFELEKDLWNFYEKEQLKFSVKNIMELEQIWHL